jgi:hypothetical protein
VHTVQVDAIAVELRPRPMAEAADLGVRLVQAHARSVWRSCAPVFAALLLVALATVEIAPWLPAVLIFWLKPWFDRSLLFVLSRAVFGQPTQWADLWRQRRQVWGGQWLATLLWRRLSPWRSYTQPVYQLEGQSGGAARGRRKQMLNGQRGAALGMHAAFAHVEFALVLALTAMAVWFAPQGSNGDVLAWLLKGEDSVASSLVSALLYAATVFALEPFYVGAGFAMYLNRRVQLEAWDIEQEFRRAF